MSNSCINTVKIDILKLEDSLEHQFIIFGTLPIVLVFPIFQKECKVNKYESMDLTTIPKAICRTAHKMKRPNARVSLHKGPMVLIGKDKTLQKLLVEGTLALHWFPTIQIVIQGNTKEQHAMEVFKIIHDNNDFDISIGDTYIGSCFISDYNDIGTKDEKTVNVRAILTTSALVGNPSIQVDTVFFHLPNIKRLPGSAVRDGTKLLRNRIQLTHRETEITIDLSPSYEQLHNQLKREGGYLFLAQGRLKSNITMTHEEVDDILFCLSRFLTLLNGRRLSPFCRQAFRNGKLIWTEFNNYHVDIFKASPSLAPRHDFIPFNDLWMGFRGIWIQDQDFIRTAVHWF